LYPLRHAFSSYFNAIPRFIYILYFFLKAVVECISGSDQVLML